MYIRERIIASERTQTHTHTYTNIYTYVYDVHSTGEENFAKKLVTVSIFYKDINSYGSFHVPEDCQHDLLY